MSSSETGTGGSIVPPNSGGPSSGIDIGSLGPPQLTDLEKGVAWFTLVFGVVFVAISFPILVLFLKNSNLFEIRARSAILCIIIGANAIVAICALITLQASLLFDSVESPDLLGMTILQYFTIMCGACCYGGRAMRLAVVFRPRLRKLAPALASERVYIVAAMFISMCMLPMPIYDSINIGTDTPFQILEYLSVTDDRVFIMRMVIQIAIFSLYPFVRNVNDIFSISSELRAVLVMLLLFSIIGKTTENQGSEMVRTLFTTENFGFLALCVTVGITIIDPMRRLYLQPIKSSERQMAKALRRRKNAGIGGVISPFGWRDARAEVSSMTDLEESRVEDTEDGTTGCETDELLTWESIVGVPQLAEAFENFARKALCQESVVFLQEIARFNEGRFDEPPSDEERLAFQEMTERFVFDGAPDEVNISSKDKKKILDLYQGASSPYHSLTVEARRSIFNEAYVEVRYMLEANLILRFVSTGEYRLAHAEAEANDNWRQVRM